MDAYSTNVGEKFAAKMVKVYYEQAVTPQITNDDYEGQIKGGGADRLNVLSYDAPDLSNYTGADLTVADLTESEATLIIDQKKAYYFRIKSWDKFKSYSEDPKDDAMDQEGGKLQEAIDTFVLGLWGDVAAGQRSGTSYTTGTVTVDVTTGAVTGAGTTFAATMVGKGFKALGHTAWYKVKSYASTTSIVIEDDSDDLASAYTGGAIGGGATYEVQSNTCVTVAAGTIYSYIVSLKTFLNKAKVPKQNRWLVINAEMAGMVDKCTELIHATAPGDEVIKNGFMGRIAGFDVYENQEVAGDSADGWHILAGHKSAITFAHAFTESGIEDLQKNFGSAYKGLNCYGGKIIDRRRKCLAEGFWKI